MQRRENGMGTIYQRDNGTWVGRIKEKGKNGKTKYKCFSGKSQAEVKRKIREYNKQSDAVDPTEVSLETYMTDWLLNAKKGKIKDSSYDRLENTAKHQVIPMIGDMHLSEITTEDINSMLNSLKENGLSYSSIKKAYDCTRAMFEYAIHRRDIVINPMALAKMPHESEFEKKEVRYFTRDEASRIVEECSRLYSTGTRVYPYGDAFILVLNTGLRMGELLGLQKQDIDFTKKVINIRRNAQVVNNRNDDGSRAVGRRVVLSTTKTYSGRRCISLNKTALEAIQRLCDAHPESEYVVCGTKGNQVTHERFEKSFYRILRNCNIEQTGVHSLRHTFASILFEKGTDIKTISTLLGHASVKITMDTYVHLIQDTGKQALDKLDEAL